MTEQMEFADQVAQMHAEVELLRHLADVTRLVSEPDPLGGTLQRLCELADRTLPACEVGMSLGEAAQELENGAASTERADRLDATQRQLGGGPCLEALATQQPVLAGPDDLMGRWPDFARVARSEGVRAVLALPFLVQGRSRGALNVYCFEADDLDERSVRLAELLAAQASTALANAQLFAQSAALARNLSVAMESRGVIEQAKGIIMWHRGCPPDEAFELLRSASQAHHVKVRDLARDLVDRAVEAAESPGTLPPPIAGILAAEPDPT